MSLYVYDPDNIRPKRIQEGPGISLVETDGTLSIESTGTVQGTWTPVVTQSGTVTTSIQHAIYRIVNKLCFITVRVNITGTGVAGNGIVISGQPALIQPVTSEQLVGNALIFDSGTAYYIGAIRIVNATNWQFFAHNQGGSMGASPSFALANGDSLYFAAVYIVN